MRVLEGCAELEVHRQETPLTKAELMARLSDKDALVCQLTQTVDAEVLTAGKKLRVVANVAVGFDNIDLATATEHGIAVTNTPGVLDETTADFAWALLLAVARRVVEADRFARSGNWKGWDLLMMVGSDVHGKTLGVIGFGRIGQRVALYHDAVRATEERERELSVDWAEKERLLRESDFVSLHVPLLPETRRLIGSKELQWMKPTAYLINTSRGPVVDESALVQALEEKRIAGATLDVFEEEPKIHPGLVGLSNVVLAPHIASASVETRTRMAMMATENVAAVLTGKRPPNLVNTEVWQD
jgi:glyoxylate reductase